MLYEEPMLVKLKLSRKLLKDILYTWQLALGIGLISPKTAIVIATLKLYIRNVRMESNVADMIDLNEQYNLVECRINRLNHQYQEVKYWKDIWIDGLEKEFYKRQLELKDEKI